MDKVIKTCKRCILNSTVPSVTFDENGICNYCKTHDAFEKEFPLNKIGEARLNQLLEKVKKVGRNKKYDCNIGLSGGVDSTYLLYWAINNGLRPLAVSFDNGMGTDIAANNVKNATNILGVDVKFIVADWEEMMDLQKAFFKSFCLSV